MASEWAFFLDENVDRAVANKLAQEGYRADLVVDVLGPGADDRTGVLPYAVENDMLVVTKDVADFGAVQYSAHEGILLVHDHEYSAFQLATGILSIIDAYGNRDDLRHTDVLDGWIR